MIRHLPTTLLVAAMLTATGCSDQFEDVCDTMAECGVFATSDVCLASIRPYEFSDSCWELLENASCADHKSQSYWKQCWPNQCDGDWHMCQGHDMVVCDRGHEVTFDCERGCETQGDSYANSCGTVSPDGSETEVDDKCWCWTKQYE